MGGICLTLHRDIKKKGETDLMNLIKYYHTKSRKDDQIYYSAKKKKRWPMILVWEKEKSRNKN